MGEIDSSD
jgi:hypothetical protein